MVQLKKGKTSVHLSIVLFCFLLLTGKAFCQTPFFSATASKSTVGLNEQFQISFSINGSARSFQAPNLAEFNVLSGPNQSNSMEFSNGSLTQTLTLSYILQPKTEGNFKIGPASVDVNGKRIASNVINVTVVKGNAPAAQNGKGQQGNDDDGGISDRNIFVRATTNKSSAYLGEAVVVNFKLYTNVSMSSPVVTKMSEFNGFWNKDIDMASQMTKEVENVNGVNYNTYEIRKIVLFPQQTGTLTIDPTEYETVARSTVRSNNRNIDPFGFFQGGDPFAAMQGYRDVKFAFKSNALKINVRELPSNAPSSFNGSVGKLNFDASLDKNTVKANEPVTLKIKISGTGNLKLAEAPEIKFPQDVETYDPKISENLKASAVGLSGIKSFEYLIIPRHEGSYTIEPVVFSYFDLDKKQYVIQRSNAFTINVTKGTGEQSMATISGSKSDFQVIGKDIRYIKIQQPDFTLATDNFYGSLPFYGLSISPVLLFFGLIFYRKRQDEINGNVSLLKIRNATAMAQKRLVAADKLLKLQQSAPVYEEVSKALWGYVSDKLTIPLSELSKETVSQVLQQHKVSITTVDEFLSTINVCEFARYGGSSATGEPKQVYDRAISLITKLEGELKA